jgi:hypothetical protein
VFRFSLGFSRLATRKAVAMRLLDANHTGMCLRALTIGVLSVAAAACGTGAGPTSPSAPPFIVQNAHTAALQPIARADLAVTEGSVEISNGRLLIDVAEMRAVVLRATTTQSIEVHFMYLGPTESTATLANGDVRRQFGVKLRAQNACNLLYVMWRAAPTSTLAVSMKHNPGMQSSSECRDGGYDTLEPTTHRTLLPDLQPGSAHVLRADIDNQDLQVRIDSGLMWEGRLPPAAMSFEGPVGLRSDNVRVIFDALVAR